MAKLWFLYINNVVSGPFTTEKIKERKSIGEIGASTFIWWKGQREWITLDTWESQLDSILQSVTTTKQKQIWYIDNGTSQLGPLTQSELIENLRAETDLAPIRVWAVGMPNWKGVYEMFDIMELLGISRREHERAPLMGSVVVTRSNIDPKGFKVKAASISIAGIGVAGAQDLHRGDVLSILINSSDLPSQLHARGEVVYVTPSGYAGIRFHAVHAEMHSIIQDYVKKFGIGEAAIRSAA